jgi:hypothetical protein
VKSTVAKNHASTSMVAEGGLALVDEKHPTNVYIPNPNVDVPIEVYDPTPVALASSSLPGRLPIR